MKRARRYLNKRHFGRLLVADAIISLSAVSVAAQTFDSGSTGADGAFNPTCTPTPCTVEVTLLASGVFNFTTVNVPTGVTVTFTRNAGNTPVTILASGNVTIAGTIDVSGQDAGAAGIPGRGGPGGFDGGMGGTVTVSLDGTAGLGPGGGGGGDAVGTSFTRSGGGAGFGTVGTGTRGGLVYGVSTLLPLIGGSGGGGAGGQTTVPGGGGGGGGAAILIASSGTITFISGSTVRANGGKGVLFVAGVVGGGGSGGGIRLIASRIEGNGTIEAKGGSGNLGGLGRIRFEAFDNVFAGTVNPPPSAGTPGPVMPPTGSPTISISAVAGVGPPANPQGNFLAPPDITLSPTVTNPVTVDLVAANVPLGTNVAVTVTPEGGDQTTVLSTALGGTQASSTASASVTLPDGVSVISATAIFATTTASLGSPMMIGGEEVKWIRVGATYGGNSTLTYITASGKEVRLR